VGAVEQSTSSGQEMHPAMYSAQSEQYSPHSSGAVSQLMVVSELVTHSAHGEQKPQYSEQVSAVSEEQWSVVAEESESSTVIATFMPFWQCEPTEQMK
jgi:hypothetical protein